MSDTTLTFVAPAAVVRHTSESPAYGAAPETMGAAVPEVHVQQRLIAADLKADAPARNIRRPRVARRSPRLTAPAFDPSLVSKTLNGSRA